MKLLIRGRTPRKCTWAHPDSWGGALSAFYDDRGSTFPLKCFLNDGALPQNHWKANLVSKTVFLYTWGNGIILRGAT